MKFNYIASSDNRPEWLEARKKVITATDVATLATTGSAGWASVKRSKTTDQESNPSPAMLHGIEREPIIAAKLSGDHWKHNTWLVSHPGFPEFAATPDVINESQDAVGDIKAAKQDSWKGIPEKYRYQVLWQMFVTGAKVGFLFVEFYTESNGAFWPSPTIDCFVIERDEEEIEFLVRTARQFLDASEPSILDQLMVDYFQLEEEAKIAKALADEAKSLIVKHVADEPDKFKHVSEIGSITKFTPKARIAFDVDAYLEAHKERAAEVGEFSKISTPKPQVRITRAAK